MVEYRIVAKLDPQTAAGSQKVRSDLRGVAQEAAATKTAINSAFDAGQFDRSIGSLVTKIGALDSSINALVGTTAAVNQSNAGLITSLDKVAASSAKANNAMNGTGAAARGSAAGQAQLAASTARVLQAIDSEAAELVRLNQLLTEARTLYEKGAISAEQFAKVEALANSGTRSTVASVGQKRAAYQQLGFQVQDITQSMVLGIPFQTVFAQQAGQTASAVGLMTNSTKGFAGFLAGPYGAIVIAATALLVGFIASNVKLQSEIDAAVESMKKDAHETEVNEAAKRKFSESIEGVTKATADANKANEEWRRGMSDDLRNTAIQTRSNFLLAQSQREITKARLADAIAQAEARLASPLDEDGVLSRKQDQDRINVENMRKLLAAQGTEITALQTRSDQALTDYLGSVAEKAIDQVERTRYLYDGPGGIIAKKKQELVLSKANAAEQGRILGALYAQRDAEVAKAQAAERAAKAKPKTPDDGVSRFKSREQAIGVAGREMLAGGLRVGENEQFGGVTGGHTMKNHGKYAIDVNSGTGVVEANIPDLKAKFDAMARRYQARGFRVLWAGQVYNPYGDGPSGPIKGANKHYDHMHVEAPQAIIGKPTGEGIETAARGEENRATGDADYIQRIVDSNGARGQAGTGTQGMLKAQIAKAKADFLRERDRLMTPGEEKTVTDSFTAADARETAARFEEAFVRPLKRLDALQGTTGLGRKILNAQLDESVRRYGDATEGTNKLTAAENAQIAAAMQQQDLREREAAILEDIQGPLDQYQQTLKALNELLSTGAINQTDYNARVGELGQRAREMVGSMPGIDPNSGNSYAQAAARGDEQARYAKELADFQTNKAEILRMGINYDSLLEAAHRRHVQNMNTIDAMRKNAALSNASDLFGQLANLQNSKSKEIAAIGKAAAITKATIDAYLAINNALATLPPPWNIAMAAAIGATALANVATIVGLKDGGIVTGPGGPRDDKVPANLSAGEFVVNAGAVARPGNRALLEAVNNGATTAGLARATKQVPGSSGMATAGGGDTYQLNFGDVVVKTGSGVTADDGKAIAGDVKAAIVGIVRDEIADAKRGGGALTTTKQSVMSGG